MSEREQPALAVLPSAKIRPGGGPEERERGGTRRKKGKGRAEQTDSSSTVPSSSGRVSIAEHCRASICWITSHGWLARRCRCCTPSSLQYPYLRLLTP